MSYQDTDQKPNPHIWNIEAEPFVPGCTSIDNTYVWIDNASMVWQLDEDDITDTRGIVQTSVFVSSEIEVIEHAPDMNQSTCLPIGAFSVNIVSQSDDDEPQLNVDDGNVYVTALENASAEELGGHLRGVVNRLSEAQASLT